MAATLTDLLGMRPYSLPLAEKKAFFLESIRSLCREHAKTCPEYARILRAERFNPDTMCDMSDAPFLPVRLFKKFELKSVPADEIVKIMTSSGTTGQAVSKICLDRANAANQTKALSRIMIDFLGPRRLPMLVLDCAATVKDRRRFSARAAGILGFSVFGRDIVYALDEDMSPDWDAIEAFGEKYRGQPVFLFGFTFMVWEYFIRPILESGRKFDFATGILVHGGGWKKLADSAVDNETFGRKIFEACRVERVHDYYGMVEQTGSIFMGCERGHLHASIFSDVIIRDAVGFIPLGKGERGLVQLLSPLATSYPGHSILSEDEGELLGEDDCPCGRLGKYFKIHGRIRHAEVRGCSDTHSAG